MKLLLLYHNFVSYLSLKLPGLLGLYTEQQLFFHRRTARYGQAGIS